MEMPAVFPVTGIAPDPVFLSIPMATATAMKGSTPFDALEGGTWAAPPEAQWVKAHFYFGDRIALEEISFTYCGEDKPNRIYGFINFDEKSVSLRHALDGEYSVELDDFWSRSLTLNFGESKGVCIKDIHMRSNGQDVIFSTPARVAGSVQASSTLDPVEAYEAMNLFDSRMEYAWSSDDTTENVTLDFHFDEPQEITGLRLWNGYQRSAVHCWKNARPMTVKFEAIGSEEVQEAVLADKLGQGEWDFGGTKLTGTDFRLTVVDAYPGKNYQDMVLSELRFIGANLRDFLIDPMNRIEEKAMANRAKFESASIGDVLDASLRGEVEEGAGAESEEVETMDAGLTLRLRSDGSFYFNGSLFQADWGDGIETSIQIFGLGNYQVKEVTEGAVTLRLFGLLRELKEEYPMGMDCNGCGRDCSQDVDESGAKASMFSDEVELISVGEGMYRLDNKDRTPEMGFRRAVLGLEGD